MRCKFCNKEIPDDTKAFCPCCGSWLNVEVKYNPETGRYWDEWIPGTACGYTFNGYSTTALMFTNRSGEELQRCYDRYTWEQRNEISYFKQWIWISFPIMLFLLFCNGGIPFIFAILAGLIIYYNLLGKIEIITMMNKCILSKYGVSGKERDIIMYKTFEIMCTDMYKEYREKVRKTEGRDKQEALYKEMMWKIHEIYGEKGHLFIIDGRKHGWGEKYYVWK